MDVIISNASTQPIYEQIYTQIKAQILSGALKEGESLPSIRSLAKDLRISVITTKRAYDELEKDGYIYTVAAYRAATSPSGTNSCAGGIPANKSKRICRPPSKRRPVCGITGEALRELLLTLLDTIEGGV